MVEKNRFVSLSFNNHVEKLSGNKDDLFKRYDEFQKQMKIIEMEKMNIQVKSKFQDEQTMYFENFATENAYKRRRAFHRILNDKETQIKLQSKLKTYQDEYKKLEMRKNRINALIEKLKPYQQFIMNVLKLLPSDYIKTHKDHSIEGFMSRFNSLFFVNELLYKEMLTSNDKIKELKETLTELQTSNFNYFVHISTTYLKMIAEKDSTKLTLYTNTLKYFDYFNKIRQKLHNNGVILLSIDNILNKCIFQYINIHRSDIIFLKSPEIKKMPVHDKLSKIFEYLQYNILLISTIAESNSLNNKTLKCIFKSDKDTTYEVWKK